MSERKWYLLDTKKAWHKADGQHFFVTPHTDGKWLLCKIGGRNQYDSVSIESTDAITQIYHSVPNSKGQKAWASKTFAAICERTVSAKFGK